MSIGELYANVCEMCMRKCKENVLHELIWSGISAHQRSPKSYACQKPELNLVDIAQSIHVMPMCGHGGVIGRCI